MKTFRCTQFVKPLENDDHVDVLDHFFKNMIENIRVLWHYIKKTVCILSEGKN